MRKPNWTRADVLCGIISAVLFVLAFPPFNFRHTIWIAPTAFFVSLENISGRRSQLTYGLFVGYLSCLGVIWWLSTVTIPGTLLLAVWSAAPWIVCAAVVRWLPPISCRGLVGLPLLWTATEWIRAQGYTSFAWCQLAHPFWQEPTLLQVTYWTGTWGLTWLVCTVSLALPLAVRSCLSHPFLRPNRGGNSGKPILRACAALAVLFLPGLGFMAGHTIDKTEAAKETIAIRVAAVQGNFGLDEKHSTEWQVYLERYEQLSLEAAKQGAELIVWPESTVVHPLHYWYSVVNRVQEIVDKAGVPILVGAVDGKNPDPETYQLAEQYNAAVLWRPGDVPLQTQTPCEIDHLPFYAKRHLVPFGETVPFGDTWPFSLIEGVVESAGGGIFEPGKEATLFDGPHDTKFAVAICFESTLEGQIAAYRKQGAQFLVVITNDAWYLQTPGAEQHLLQSSFRAAENQIPVIRAANTGITAFIDHRGQITDRLPWFTDDVLTGDIQITLE